MIQRIKMGWTVLLLVLLATMIFVACDLEGSESSVGALKITLRDEITTRTIAPDLDMDVETYMISCTRIGSSDQRGPVEVTAPSYTFNNIQTGEWIVTVEAFNNDLPAVKIGEGTKVATVIRGSMTEASVSIVPLTGRGDFTFTIDWTGTIVDSLEIDAFLTPEEYTTEIPINIADIATSGSITTITVEDLDVGYYDFSYVLKDGSTPFAGNFHEVRIIKDQTSSATEVIPVSPLGISVSVINNLYNPFAVTISSEDFIMERRNAQTFTASPAESAAYQWYLDGVKIAGATEATYEVDGEGMAYGWHTLSVKVKRADGWFSSSTEAFYMDQSAGSGGLVELLFTNKAKSDDTWFFSLSSGPAHTPNFDVLAIFGGDSIPAQMEMMLEQSHTVYLPGSFMAASSVPIDIGNSLNMFPLGGDGNDEHVLTVMGAWEVDYDNVQLFHPYEWCLFMTTMVDQDGVKRNFEAINNFYNPPVGSDGLRWGDWESLYEAAGEGVSITFTKYGEGLGSYVKGTIEGTVLSPIPDPVDPYDYELMTLGLYTVTGTFITTRGTWIAPE